MYLKNKKKRKKNVIKNNIKKIDFDYIKTYNSYELRCVHLHPIRRNL